MRPNTIVAPSTNLVGAQVVLRIQQEANEKASSSQTLGLFYEVCSELAALELHASQLSASLSAAAEEQSQFDRIAGKVTSTALLDSYATTPASPRSATNHHQLHDTKIPVIGGSEETEGLLRELFQCAMRRKGYVMRAVMVENEGSSRRSHMGPSVVHLLVTLLHALAAETSALNPSPQGTSQHQQQISEVASVSSRLDRTSAALRQGNGLFLDIFDLNGRNTVSSDRVLACCERIIKLRCDLYMLDPRTGALPAEDPLLASLLKIAAAKMDGAGSVGSISPPISPSNHASKGFANNRKGLSVDEMLATDEPVAVGRAAFRNALATSNTINTPTSVVSNRNFNANAASLSHNHQLSMLSFEENASNAKTLADEAKGSEEEEPSPIVGGPTRPIVPPSAEVYYNEGPHCQHYLLQSTAAPRPLASCNDNDTTTTPDEGEQYSPKLAPVLLQVVWSQCVTGVFYELYSDGEVRLKRFISNGVLKGSASDADLNSDDDGRDGAIVTSQQKIVGANVTLTSPRVFVTPPSTPTLSMHSPNQVGGTANAQKATPAQVASFDSKGSTGKRSTKVDGHSVMGLLKSVSPNGLHVLQAGLVAPNDTKASNPLASMKVVSVSPYSDERMISSSLVGGEEGPGGSRSTRDELKCDVIFFNTGECALVYHMLLIAATVQYAFKVREAKKEALRGLGQPTARGSETGGQAEGSGAGEDSPMLSVRSGVTSGRLSPTSPTSRQAVLDSAAATIPFPKELEEEIIVDIMPPDGTQKSLSWLPNVARQIQAGAAEILSDNLFEADRGQPAIPPPSSEHVGLAMNFSFTSGDLVPQALPAPGQATASKTTAAAPIVGTIVASTGYGTVTAFHLRAPLGVKRLYPRHLPQMIRSALNSKATYSSIPSQVFARTGSVSSEGTSSPNLNLFSIAGLFSHLDNAQKSAEVLAAERFFAVASMAEGKGSTKNSAASPHHQQPPEIPPAMFPLVRHLKVRIKPTADHSIASDMSSREAKYMGMTGNGGRTDTDDCFAVTYGEGPNSVVFLLSVNNSPSAASALVLRDAGFGSDLLNITSKAAARMGGDLLPPLPPNPRWRGMGFRLKDLVGGSAKGSLIPNVASISGALQLAYVSDGGVVLQIERQTADVPITDASTESNSSLMRVRCSVAPPSASNRRAQPPMSPVLTSAPNISGCIPARAANGRLTVFVTADGHLVALNEAIGIFGRVPQSLIMLPTAAAASPKRMSRKALPAPPAGLMSLSFSPEGKYLMAQNVLTGAVMIAVARYMLSSQLLEFVGGSDAPNGDGPLGCPSPTSFDSSEDDEAEAEALKDHLDGTRSGVLEEPTTAFSEEGSSPRPGTAPLALVDARAIAASQTIPDDVARLVISTLLPPREDKPELMGSETNTAIRQSQMKTVLRYSDSFYQLLFDTAPPESEILATYGAMPSSVHLTDSNGCNALHCLISCTIARMMGAPSEPHATPDSRLPKTIMAQFTAQFCDYISVGVSLVATATGGPLAGYSPLAMLGLAGGDRSIPISLWTSVASDILKARVSSAQKFLGSVDVDLVIDTKSEVIREPLTPTSNNTQKITPIGTYVDGVEHFSLALHYSAPTEANLTGHYSLVCEVSNTANGSYCQKTVHDFDDEDSEPPAVAIASVRLDGGGGSDDKYQGYVADLIVTGDGCVMTVSTSNNSGIASIRAYKSRVRPIELSAQFQRLLAISFVHSPSPQWACSVLGISSATKSVSTSLFAFPRPSPNHLSKSELANSIAVNLVTLFYPPVADASASEKTFSHCVGLSHNSLFVATDRKQLVSVRHGASNAFHTVSCPQLALEHIRVSSVHVDQNVPAGERRFAVIILEASQEEEHSNQSRQSILALFDSSTGRITAISSLNHPNAQGVAATITISEAKGSVLFLDAHSEDETQLILRVFKDLKEGKLPALFTVFVEGNPATYLDNHTSLKPCVSLSIDKIEHRLTRTTTLPAEGQAVITSVSPVNL